MLVIVGDQVSARVALEGELADSVAGVEDVLQRLAGGRG